MIPLVKSYIAPREEMMPEIEKVLYSGYIAVGEVVAEFEREFGTYIANPNVVALNSGTAALHIALELLHIGAGDEVISTAMTAEPTNTAIAMTGAKIVWADVNPDTGLLAPDSVESKVTERTKAIMLVHYAGMVCDMDAFNKLSKKYSIPVIEDCAHALGSRYAGKRIGTNSKYSCFSFQAIKHMTTVDGGMISLSDENEAEEVKKLRFFGLNKKVSRLENDITRVGYKYGMNNVNAAIGLVQMKHLNQIIEKHIDNGKYYDRSLKTIPGIRTIPYYSNTQPSYWLYTMHVEDRDNFCKMMEANGIAASPLHHRNDTHSVFNDSACELPGLDKFYSDFVHIPCGWWVDNEMRETIVDTIKKGW